MSITAVEVLSHATLSGLSTLATAAIADGKQPVGGPWFEHSGGAASAIWCWTFITGAPTVSANIDDVLSATLTLTTAQVLALNATPIQIVAAPGAGKAIVPVLWEAFLDYNSAAYAGVGASDDLTLKYTNGSGNVVGTIETTGFVDQTADQRRILINSGTITPTANAALVVHMATGEVTTGDSPILMRVDYRVITLATA